MMKLSQTGMGTTKLNNIDEMYPGQSILLQTGQLVQYGAGLFGYNTVPLLVRRKIEKIIVETLNKYGCIEVSLPTLQPDTIWKNSGRYEQFAREKLKSYKNLPVTYYQIGEKFRNEIRTRGYLLRGKAFPMLDAYTFDTNVEGMEKSYQNVRKAFLEIFKKIGLDVIPIVADNGAMGGKKSEEFMLISEQGEDKILYNEKTGIGLNTEILEREDYKTYLKVEYGIEDISDFKEIRTMELGHIFQLGTRYSEMMNGKYINQEGKEELYYMGCYGIGVSRTLAALYEQCVIKDEKYGPCGFALPYRIAPYKLQIIPKVEDGTKMKMAEEIIRKLEFMGIQVILDDRENISIGSKIKDARLLGTPYVLVLGDKQQGENLEIENLKTGEKIQTTIKEISKVFLEKSLRRDTI